MYAKALNIKNLPQFLSPDLPDYAKQFRHNKFRNNQYYVYEKK